MVDASVGDKTGINFNGLKNEIGSFAPADSVLIDNYEQNAEAVEAASTSFREYRQKDRELATKVMETIMKLIDDYK